MAIVTMALVVIYKSSGGWSLGRRILDHLKPLTRGCLRVQQQAVEVHECIQVPIYSM